MAQVVLRGKRASWGRLTLRNPIIIKNDEPFLKVNNLLNSKRRLSVWMLSEQFLLSKTTVHEMATEKLRINECVIVTKGVNRWTRWPYEDVLGTPWLYSWWSEFSRKYYYWRRFMSFRILSKDKAPRLWMTYLPPSHLITKMSRWVNKTWNQRRLSFWIVKE